MKSRGLPPWAGAGRPSLRPCYKQGRAVYGGCTDPAAAVRYLTPHGCKIDRAGPPHAALHSKRPRVRSSGREPRRPESRLGEVTRDGARQSLRRRGSSALTGRDVWTGETATSIMNAQREKTSGTLHTVSSPTGSRPRRLEMGCLHQSSGSAWTTAHQEGIRWSHAAGVGEQRGSKFPIWLAFT